MEMQLEAQANNQMPMPIEELKKSVRRGDGIADFLLVKAQFGKCKEDVIDIERRLKGMEELFHKQSIIQSSNEIVTTAALQNYLDAMTSHIEKQFADKIAVHTELIQSMLDTQKEEVKVLVKSKAPKHKVERLISHLGEQIMNNSMRLESVFSGLEMSIMKNTYTKAEMKDVEGLDKQKADISEVRRVDERLDRLEKLVQERLNREGEESEGDYDDELNETDQSLDPEELKDQINDEPTLFKLQQRAHSTDSLDASQIQPSDKEDLHPETPVNDINGSPMITVPFFQNKRGSVEEGIEIFKAGQSSPFGINIRAHIENSVQHHESLARQDTPRTHAQQSSRASNKNSVSQHRSSRRGSILKNQLARKAVDMVEFENIKKELADSRSMIKDIQDQIQDSLKPQCDFIAQNQTRFLGLMGAYEASIQKIAEMESYDDQLKQKYLKAALQHISDVKGAIDKEINGFRDRQKIERDQFMVKMKTVETETDYTKTKVDFMTKVIQQHKYFGGCNIINSIQGTSTGLPRESTYETEEDAIMNNQPTGSSFQNVVSVPHQLVLLKHQIEQLQNDFEEARQQQKTHVLRVTTELDELRRPYNDVMQNLKKENANYERELDRYDSQYKRLFSDYADVLQQNKSILEQVTEQRLSTQQQQPNFINTATIQYFGGILPQTAVTSPTSTGFSSRYAMTESKPSTHMWRRNKVEITHAKILALDQKVALAQKKVKELSHVENIIDTQRGNKSPDPLLLEFDQAQQTRLPNRTVIGSSRQDELKHIDRFQNLIQSQGGNRKSQNNSSFSQSRKNNAINLNRTLQVQSPNQRKVVESEASFVDGIKMASTPSRQGAGGSMPGSSHARERQIIGSQDAVQIIEGKYNLKRFNNML